LDYISRTKQNGKTGFNSGQNIRRKAMSDAFKRIEKSLKDAIAYAEGKEVKVRVYRPLRVNVQRVRHNVGMTQTQFAATFGIGLGTLRHWERGDREPKGAALVLLNMLAKEPKTVLRILYRYTA
jgi:putative transcriptional regulator